MKIALCAAIFTVISLALTVAATDNSDRIYGKITTTDGDEFEGLIRWDRNEANWVDLLDGTKQRDRRQVRDDRKSRRRKYKGRNSGIELFGIKFGTSHVTFRSDGSSQSGIRFGHLRSLEVTGDNSAMIVTKSGLEFELSGGSTDLGTDIREIVIEDESEGEIELSWDDIDIIEFYSSKSNLVSNFGYRLYGTLTTRRGDEYTGYVCWDFDEVFSSDILDGKEKGRKRKIKFGKLSAIERYSSSGARLIFLDGKEIVLKGSNDVNSDNRGIVISDPKLGQVVVEWNEFDRLKFEKIPRPERYDDFDGGDYLKGTVTTEDDDVYQGRIRWDNDEEYTWELLNGNYHDVSFDIEFGKIAEIEKRGCCSSIITLSDGRKLKLRGSNDVDDDNKGIFITTDDGEVIEVEWEDFYKVKFDQ